MTINDLLSLANNNHQAGRLDDAEKLYRQVLAAQPDHPDALHLLGVIAHQVGRNDMAMELIGRAITLRPTSADYYSNIGLVFVARGDIDQAIAAFQKAIELKPDYPEALFNLANMAGVKGEYNIAINLYQRAAQSRPRFWPGFRNLAKALTKTGQWDRAVAAYQQTLAIQGTEPNGQTMRAELLHELGDALYSAGQIAQAGNSYQEALKLKPESWEVLNNLGNCFCSMRRFAEGIEVYRRSLALRPQSPATLNNVGNALVAIGQTDQAILAYRQGLEIQSDIPDLWGNLGNAFKRKRQMDQAIECYQKVLALSPNSAQALAHMADAMFEKRQYPHAMQCCLQALAADVTCPDAHNVMGNLRMVEGDIDQAIASFQQAMVLRRNDIDSCNNLGSAYYARGDIDKAIECYQSVISQRPDHAMAHWNFGLMLLTRGEYQRAWPEYEWRWQVNEFNLRRNFNQSHWNGQNLDGKRIMLYSEQGLGDVLQFVRYAPLVAARGGKVIVSCQPELHRLLKSMPEISELHDWKQAPMRFDSHCPLMSLPGVFNSTVADIPSQVPYLHADPELIEHWKSRMPEGVRKIGLAWAGRPEHFNDRNRSFPLSTFAPLAGAGGLWFTSLQVGEPGRHERPPGLELTDWTDELKDLADTAALIANLDLVITADTAVAHLAGAMGKPVWILLAFMPDWRWMLHRSDSPWYPTARLFRQPTRGDWQSPMAQIVQALGTP